MRPVVGGRRHAERRMGRLAVVVDEPAAELREHGLGIAALGAEDVVAFERVHEGLGEPIALGDRHEGECMRVEHGGRTVFTIFCAA